MNMNLFIGKEANSMEINELFVDNGDDYESCWQNGNYVDQYCPCCPYKDECSGYDEEDQIR